jgi:ABC-type spermidine/putrescine transport system permease subunit II
MNRGLSTILAWIGVAAVLLFLFLPIAILVLFSFNSGAALSFPLQGVSLTWYHKVLTDPVYLASLQNSFFVAVVTAVTTTVLGTAAAFALTLAAPKWRAVCAALFFAPVTLPGLFLGLSLLSLFAQTGVSPSLYTVMAAHVVFTFPYFVLIGRAALDRIDPGYEETAADLGATRWQRFTRVTLPMVWPLILAGSVLSFALSFDEFVLTFFVIGTQSTTPLVIWSAMRRSVDPSINAIATLLLLVTTLTTFTIAGLAALRRISRKAST